jgi:hypothetical protein
MPNQAKPGSRTPHDEKASDKVLKALAALRYGSVEITVHDRHIVQIERREKVRVEPNGPS